MRQVRTNRVFAENKKYEFRDYANSERNELDTRLDQRLQRAGFTTNGTADISRSLETQVAELLTRIRNMRNITNKWMPLGTLLFLRVFVSLHGYLAENISDVIHIGP